MKVIIAGAGIAGLTTAIALQRKGINAVVYEAAPEIKAVGAGLALAANAMKGYDVIGLKDTVVARGRFLEAFVIYDEKGRTITLTDSKKVSALYGQDNFTIHRADLHEVLVNELLPGQLQTGKRVTRVDDSVTSVKVFFEDGTSTEADVLIASDGIHSPVRKQLFPDYQIRYAGYTCWRGVTDAGDIQLARSSETWSANGRFGLVPLPGNRIYWFACLNAPPSSSTMRSYGINDLLHHFGTLHQPIPQVLKQTPEETIIWGDICDLEPMPVFSSGRVVFIGDAAHATTPNMGQGACQAVEDAIVLADELAKNRDWETAFACYNRRRVARTHYVVNTSKRIGEIAQLTGSFAVGARNILFRMMPDGVAKRQLKKLYQVDF